MSVTLGYTIFYVDDVRSTLDFYKSAFGLPEKFVTPDGDYGEVDTGATTLSFASNTLAESNLSHAGGFIRLDPASPPPGISITLITTDVAATVQAAIESGARPYAEPVDKPWGQTVAYVLDPNGVLLEVATPVST
ncbi:MAG: VOC family protein [Acidimicrobiales bacterium]